MKLLIDLDGTLLNASIPTPDSVKFMLEVSRREIDFRIMTNSILKPDLAVQRLGNVGIHVDGSRILNPIVSINSYLQRQNIHTAFIVGTSLEKDQVQIRHAEANPEVVIFLDFEKGNADYQLLQRVFEHVQKGIPVISASGSVFYKGSTENRIDTGAFVKMFESLAAEPIRVFGKPSEDYFHEAFERLGTKAEDVTVIGDDWSTDIFGAKRVGCRSILVRTGKYRQNDEDKVGPTRTINCLMEYFD